MIIYPNNYNGDRQFWCPFLLGGFVPDQYM